MLAAPQPATAPSEPKRPSPRVPLKLVGKALPRWSILAAIAVVVLGIGGFWIYHNVSHRHKTDGVAKTVEQQTNQLLEQPTTTEAKSVDQGEGDKKTENVGMTDLAKANEQIEPVVPVKEPEPPQKTVQNIDLIGKSEKMPPAPPEVPKNDTAQSQSTDSQSRGVVLSSKMEEAATSFSGFTNYCADILVKSFAQIDRIPNARIKQQRISDYGTIKNILDLVIGRQQEFLGQVFSMPKKEVAEAAYLRNEQKLVKERSECTNALMRFEAQVYNDQFRK
jgi:hypothetical protein